MQQKNRETLKQIIKSQSFSSSLGGNDFSWQMDNRYFPMKYPFLKIKIYAAVFGLLISLYFDYLW